MSQLQRRPLRVAIVAGEASGDILGAGLIVALRRHHPGLICEGVGGPLMIEQGFVSHFDMERLSIMGFVEPLKRLPELLKMRASIVRRFIDDPPDLFIGIDSPDFTLNIELKLRAVGIKTAHYVSPSVWMWRQKRVFKIKKAVDMMLTLLPFEAEFYRRFDVPVTFVGHPLADQLPMLPDTAGARRAFSLKDDDCVLCLMPGSRGSEVKFLGELFLRVALKLSEALPGLRVLLPMANAARAEQLQAIVAEMDESERTQIERVVTFIDGDSHRAMEASDTVLLASGTTALEAMLLKKPMVVSYRMGGMSFAILKRLAKVPYVALPNLLAGRAIIPEALQYEANIENLTALVLTRLKGEEDIGALVNLFSDYHRQLKQGASDRAAEALLALLEV
ncbi:lipid-A-disaccharide synthase [Sinobacterium caligoides]|uniref:Lipid-A-disaccharide synthase n=1 Tax=Sinobacterium caligoides TaxID=933926 RepID=A0A3N2DNY6_9GAMM|nr:lipid-A-disaccharide synthase [Sinobacterium caligoides]ROS01035.1 lipid-A-disaccharide synthase [Sinobacterium caligoides]